ARPPPPHRSTASARTAPPPATCFPHATCARRGRCSTPSPPPRHQEVSTMNIDRRFPSPGRRVARLLPLLLAAALATACSSNASDGADAMPAPEVSVARVLEREVRQWDDFTGRVAAVETVELRPRVSGYVQRVAFEEGQLVRKGDLLFEIDPRPYRAALARAEAELVRARSEARLAAAQHERAQALVEARAISREEFETRNAANAQGHAAVRAAEAAVAAARLDLQFTQVRAPIDGRAGRALVTVGNLAQADATVLTTVVSQDPVHVYFEADEQTWLRYSRDAGSGRDGDGRVVRAGLAGEDGRPHAGTLDFIDNQVAPATGTTRARAVLRNPPGPVRPGPAGGRTADAGAAGRRQGGAHRPGPQVRLGAGRGRHRAAPRRGTWPRDRGRAARGARGPVAGGPRDRERRAAGVHAR